MRRAKVLKPAPLSSDAYSIASHYRFAADEMATFRDDARLKDHSMSCDFMTRQIEYADGMSRSWQELGNRLLSSEKCDAR